MNIRCIGFTITSAVMLAISINGTCAERLVAKVCFMGEECVDEYILNTKKVNDKVKVSVRDVYLTKGKTTSKEQRKVTISCNSMPPDDHAHALEYTLWMDVCRGQKTDWSPN